MNSSKSLMRLLCDEYMMKILFATERESLSINEICTKYGIPLTACYRRVEFLKKMEFLRETGIRLSDKNRKVSLYSSAIDMIHLSFENGQMLFETENTEGKAFATIKDIITDKEVRFEPFQKEDEYSRK